MPDGNLYVYIPTVNRRLALAFNGQSILEFENGSLLTGSSVAGPVMARVPNRGIVPGRQQLSVVVEQGIFTIPAYMSPIYFGTEAVLAGPYNFGNFIDVQLKAMALAAHLVLGLALIYAYFLRPKDPLFAWLGALNVVSIFVALGVQFGGGAEFRVWKELWLGLDSRFHVASNQTNTVNNFWTTGIYGAIGF